MNFRSHISPELPLQIMYNAHTDVLGISAEGWELIATIKFIPFVRTPADRYGFEATSGPEFGQVPVECVVEKTPDWEVVGEL